MTKLLKTLITIFLLIISIKITPQSTINTSGGLLTGNSSKIDFSIGQLLYTNESSNNCNISFGIIQINEARNPIVTNLRQIITDIFVYPNQSSQYINIFNNSEYSIKSYKIIDLSGKVIAIDNNLSKNNKYQINISKLNNGVYFINIDIQQSNEVTFKFIKQ